jgi:mersacidin/lichenicidin family type 2 lantibiotic
MHNEANTVTTPQIINKRSKSIMSKETIIRAWRDEEYLLSLSEELRALLPEHPAGLIELSDEELELVAGGFGPTSVGCLGLGPTAIGCLGLGPTAITCFGFGPSL